MRKTERFLLYPALIALSCSLAFGQTYKVLWSFAGSPTDGAYPVSGLVGDTQGNLYGTTVNGGTVVPCQSTGCGAAFELSPNGDGMWTERLLYSFCADDTTCADGYYPLSGLIFDHSGNLYGTTSWGGSSSCGYRCGTVFELSPSGNGQPWIEQVLYNFCASNERCPDGGQPESQLVFDATGNLYGTTFTGGEFNAGTVFEVSPGGNGWSETVIHNFCTGGHGSICPDGSEPAAGVTFDKAGNLYGTTTRGGVNHYSGNGAIYKLSPGSNGWTETVLVGFGFLSKIAGMVAPVSFDPKGNLYTTQSLGYYGVGGVLQLVKSTQKLRNVFWGLNAPVLGGAPTGGVFVDPKTNAIYGTNSFGGAFANGTVWKIDAAGNQTALYAFCQQSNCADGQQPMSSLYMDSAGNLYGTTQYGGAYGKGVVFEITP